MVWAGSYYYNIPIVFRVTGRLISMWPKIILEVDNEGDLPIHQACRQGNSDIVAMLLQQDQPQKDIKLIQLARLSLDLKYWYVTILCIYTSSCVCACNIYMYKL